jgi:hypothetical protein
MSSIFFPFKSLIDTLFEEESINEAEKILIKLLYKYLNEKDIDNLEIEGKKIFE